MKFPDTMSVTRDGQGELYVSVCDLEDALRAMANTQVLDQGTAHTLRLAASLLRPAVLASLRASTTGIRFTFSGPQRQLMLRVISFASESDTYHRDQDTLDRLWKRLSGESTQPGSKGGIRPSLNEDELETLESVIEFASESESFLSEDAQLNTLWRRLRTAHRRLATARLSLTDTADTDITDTATARAA